MPVKYHIHTEPARPRLRPVGKLGIVDWREDCSSCHNCVKRSCVYGLYRDESEQPALDDHAGAAALSARIDELAPPPTPPQPEPQQAIARAPEPRIDVQPSAADKTICLAY